MNATDKTSVFAAFDKAAKELGKARNTRYRKNGALKYRLAELKRISEYLICKGKSFALNEVLEVFMILYASLHNGFSDSWTVG